jgi:hypothetical protein
MVIDLNETPANGVDEGIAHWRNFPASTIAHHGAKCCDIAREWITGMDFSQLNAGHPLTGPRWLRTKFKWGPSKWPIHWCEAVREKTLDCGALGALSHELFVARGIRSFPAQFILEFNEASARHWKETWRVAGSCAPWLREGLIYHEGCAVAVSEGEIKLWDATATWWINPRQFGGYAGVLAVRVFGSEAASPFLKWGEHQIPLNTWHKIARARGDFAPPALTEKPAPKRRSRARKKLTVPAATA